MVLIERHLIDVPKDAPIDEVADETCQSGNSLAHDLIKGHLDVFLSNLLRCIVQRVGEVLGISRRSLTVVHDAHTSSGHLRLGGPTLLSLAFTIG